MLRASRTVLRPNGQTAFLAIELAPGLDRDARRRARAAAPRAVGSRRACTDLLTSAGFGEVRFEDVTTAYIETLSAWLANCTPHEQALASLDGETAVTARLTDWRDALKFAERGWLRRTLYWASR